MSEVDGSATFEIYSLQSSIATMSKVDVDGLCDDSCARGLHYGASFQGVSEDWQSESDAVDLLELPAAATGANDGCSSFGHRCLLARCVPSLQPRYATVPVCVKSFSVFVEGSDMPSQVFVHVSKESETSIVVRVKFTLSMVSHCSAWIFKQSKILHLTSKQPWVRASPSDSVDEAGDLFNI